MNKVKTVIKILITAVCLFIAFELLGLIVNIVVANFQTSRALSHITSNSGSRGFNKSFVEWDDHSESLMLQTVIIFSANSKTDIEENIKTEFSDCKYEIITFDEAVKGDGKNVRKYEYYPDYNKYKADRSFTKENSKENCYVLAVWDKAPFSHNLIGYLINYHPAEENK